MFTFQEEPSGPLTHPVAADLVIFDADGTLRRCTGHSTATAHAPCHNGPGEWELIPGVPAVLARYDWTRVGVGIASNQAGIGLGYISERRVRREFARLIEALFPDFPAPILWRVRYAKAAPDAASPERKPSPWMLLDLIRTFQARLDRTVYVGDSDVDAEAAARAGVAFVPAWRFFGWPPQPLNAQRHDTPERRPR